MNATGTPKVQLSRSVLEMKFMKRTKEKVEKEKFKNEGEEYFENQLTTKMKKESEKYIIEPSFVICEKLIEGRLSFGGMNPEIEKILEKEKMEKLKIEEKSRETDISDKQMVNHYKSTLITTIGSKFRSKKSRNSNKDENEPNIKKLKFLAPKD